MINHQIWKLKLNKEIILLNFKNNKCLKKLIENLVKAKKKQENLNHDKVCMNQKIKLGK